MENKMKFCGHCGHDLSRAVSFCPNCGKPIKTAATSSAVEQPVELYNVPESLSGQYTPYQQARPPVKAKKSPVMLISAAVLGAVILICAVILAMHLFGDDSSEDIGSGDRESRLQASPTPTIHDFDSTLTPTPAPTPILSTPVPTPSPTPTPATPAPPPKPSEIFIVALDKGGMLDNITIYPQESVDLILWAEPSGAYVSIDDWYCSDGSLIDVSYLALAVQGSYDTLIVTGIKPGTATVTVKAGSLEAKCTINVKAGEFSFSTLANYLQDPSLYARFTVYWTSGTYRGVDTYFERFSDDPKWWMKSRTGDYREVDPVFSYGKQDNKDVFIIEFPLTTTNAYYIYEDGSGYFGTLDRTSAEAVTWVFEYRD
ncbi:MAG: zinc ribbon domain-containing protein [Oscillospiraceae bacterium]|nr:zinc ribbon domain-containing protein [Oscillospiraceae bacterium]